MLLLRLLLTRVYLLYCILYLVVGFSLFRVCAGVLDCWLVYMFRCGHTCLQVSLCNCICRCSRSSNSPAGLVYPTPGSFLHILAVAFAVVVAVASASASATATGSHSNLCKAPALVNLLLTQLLFSRICT